MKDYSLKLNPSTDLHPHTSMKMKYQKFNNKTSTKKITGEAKIKELGYKTYQTICPQLYKLQGTQTVHL